MEMDRTKRAAQLFENGMNCSQAILAAFGEPYGIDLDSAVKMGRAWGGGIGRMGLTCGAVTGAIAVLGLAQENLQDESDARNNIASAVKKLMNSFEESHGTVSCKELLGADFSTEAGQKKIKEEMLVKKLCPRFVEDACKILTQVLEL